MWVALEYPGVNKIKLRQNEEGLNVTTNPSDEELRFKSKMEEEIRTRLKKFAKEMIQARKLKEKH